MTDEMNKFLETQNLPRLSWIESMNRCITSKEIESNQNLPIKKCPGPEGFTGRFYPTFKELIPAFLKFFQKAEEEGMLPNSFCEASITDTKARQRH